MNDQQPRSLSVHLPVGLVALTLAVFFMAQIGAANRSSETIHWQLENSDKQLTELRDAEKQLSSLVEKRKDLVEQSQKVQGQYIALFNDVLELSKTDEDAAKVVEKWKIQRNLPAEGAKGDEKEEKK
jgi:hypothetical protein